MRTAISPHVASSLGLVARRSQSYRLSNGDCVEAKLTGPVLFEIMQRDVVDEVVIVGQDEPVVVGQIVLRKLDLLIDHGTQRLTPNPAHPDGPVFPLRPRFKSW